MSLPKPFKPPESKYLEREVEDDEKPVLLYFIEPDSNLCQLIEPAVSRTCQNHVNIFEFLAARISDYRDYFYQWRIRSCPAFIIFRRGDELRRLVDFQYHDNFDNEFQDFLVGRFLFDTASFELVDSVSMPHLINTGNYFHLTAFMKPGDPNNWQLKPRLEEIKNRRTSQVRLSLANAKKNAELVDEYDVSSFPSVLLFQSGSCVKRWQDISDLQEFVRECEDRIRDG